MTLKRVLDVSTAAFAMVLLGPLMLVVAALVRIELSQPVLFRQTRIGVNGKPFTILKFRSMRSELGPVSRRITVDADPRITRLGTVLRKYKLDELPQLVNILRGDMSIVGPRPEIPEYVDRYPPATREIVLSVRPGLTDYASLEFINESKLLASAVDPDEYYVSTVLPRKLELAVRYVNTQCLSTDLHLIARTVVRLLRG